MNHRDAGAFEKRSPTEAQSKEEQVAEVREDSLEPDILVVVSKVKAYIRSRSGMNTSDRVMNVLSDCIRRMADEAIQYAEQHQRKTVLDRDIR